MFPWLDPGFVWIIALYPTHSLYDLSSHNISCLSWPSLALPYSWRVQGFFRHYYYASSYNSDCLHCVSTTSTWRICIHTTSCRCCTRVVLFNEINYSSKDYIFSLMQAVVRNVTNFCGKLPRQTCSISYSSLVVDLLDLGGVISHQEVSLCVLASWLWCLWQRSSSDFTKHPSAYWHFWCSLIASFSCEVVKDSGCCIFPRRKIFVFWIRCWIVGSFNKALVPISEQVLMHRVWPWCIVSPIKRIYRKWASHASVHVLVVWEKNVSSMFWSCLSVVEDVQPACSDTM